MHPHYSEKNPRERKKSPTIERKEGKGLGIWGTHIETRTIPRLTFSSLQREETRVLGLPRRAKRCINEDEEGDDVSSRMQVGQKTGVRLREEEEEEEVSKKLRKGREKGLWLFQETVACFWVLESVFRHRNFLFLEIERAHCHASSRSCKLLNSLGFEILGDLGAPNDSVTSEERAVG